MRYIFDKLSYILMYLKHFFVKQHQQLPIDVHHQVILVSPMTNPMDDLPECNFRAERDGFAFRI